MRWLHRLWHGHPYLPYPHVHTSGVWHEQCGNCMLAEAFQLASVELTKALKGARSQGRVAQQAAADDAMAAAGFSEDSAATEGGHVPGCEPGHGATVNGVYQLICHCPCHEV